MNKEIYTLDKIKKESIQVFKNYPFIEKAYLFGSYARNEATDDSDLDFYIVPNRQVGMEFFELTTVLEEQFKKPIDVLLEEEIKQTMPKVLEKGVLIYEQ